MFIAPVIGSAEHSITELIRPAAIFLPKNFFIVKNLRSNIYTLFYHIKREMSTSCTKISFLLIINMTFVTIYTIKFRLIIKYNFYKARKISAYLNTPYILWVLFAAYLNITTAILN
ncbi:MAG: tryptophan-rich sensory protein [Oscillospiraceae bacterium]